MPKLSVVAMIALGAFTGPGATIETKSESFVGSVTSIPGVQGTGERTSLFSLRAVRPALYRGKVSSVGTAAITDSGANWTSALFAGRGAMYAEFDSGLEADIEQVDAALKTLSFSGALPPAIAPGVNYRIREHHTVGKIFGYGNETGLLAGPNDAVAESILHFNNQTQQRRTYFYLNLEGFTGWVQLNYSPASNIVIYPEQGLMIRRRTSGEMTLTSSGPVKEWPSAIVVFPGNNLLGLHNRTRPVPLGSLNLLAGGFRGGANAQTGDLIRKVNADGFSTTTYFYLNLAGFEGWYDTAYQPAGQVTLSPGAVFLIYRQPGGGAFEWTLPSE